MLARCESQQKDLDEAALSPNLSDDCREPGPRRPYRRLALAISLAGVPPFGQPFELRAKLSPNWYPPGTRRGRNSSRRSTVWRSASAQTWRCSIAPESRSQHPAGRSPPAAAAAPEAGCERRMGRPFPYICRTIGGLWHVFRSSAARARLYSQSSSAPSPLWLPSVPSRRATTTGQFERLQRGVESLGAGDLGRASEVEGRDEVGRVAELNQAAARIESLVGTHKILLAHASHELRTPLTRIRLGVGPLRRLPNANGARKKYRRARATRGRNPSRRPSRCGRATGCTRGS